MFIHWQCVPLPRNVPTERPNGIKNFELRITKPKRYHLNIFTAIKTFSILSLDRFIYYTKPEEVEQAEATKKKYPFERKTSGRSVKSQFSAITIIYCSK